MLLRSPIGLIGLLSGGYGTDELMAAGAFRVYDDHAARSGVCNKTVQQDGVWHRSCCGPVGTLPGTSP